MEHPVRAQLRAEKFLEQVERFPGLTKEFVGLTRMFVGLNIYPLTAQASDPHPEPSIKTGCCKSTKCLNLSALGFGDSAGEEWVAVPSSHPTTKI
jgi:hypothetical protein